MTLNKIIETEAEYEAALERVDELLAEILLQETPSQAVRPFK